MPTIRLPHSATVEQQLADRVRAEFGSRATIATTREVRAGGFYGFFARRFVEATVELPAVQATPPVRTPENVPNDERYGHARLPPLSTDSAAFEQVLGDLAQYAGMPGYDRRTPVPPPNFLTARGDLVVIAGLGTDAATAVQSALGRTAPVQVYVGGNSSPRGRRIDDRQEAMAARADSAENGSSAVVAYGLGTGSAHLWRHLRVLATLGADQLWLVIDPSRKAEDTEAWVRAVQAEIRVDGLIVVSSVHTATPGSVHALGLPELWAESVGIG